MYTCEWDYSQSINNGIDLEDQYSRLFGKFAFKETAAMDEIPPPRLYAKNISLCPTSSE